MHYSDMFLLRKSADILKTSQHLVNKMIKYYYNRIILVKIINADAVTCFLSTDIFKRSNNFNSIVTISNQRNMRHAPNSMK